MGKKNKDQTTSKEQEQIKNPHDRFLKRTLEDVKKVVGTLEGILPPELFERLQLDTLQKEDTSYIDRKLKQFFSDIVYSCRTTDEIPLKIAFLFEHKSYPPDYPHLQLLRYMLEIWDRQAKEKQSLCLILPILIYHGKEAWEYRSFTSYFAGKLDDVFSKYVPLFRFLVANFQATSYAEINQRFRLASLRIAFRLMKSIRDEDLPQKIGDIFEGLSELEKDAQGRTYFETIIVYLLYGSNVNATEVMESLYNISQETGEFANSPAMQLIRKGREEAWAEAQQKIEEAKKKEVEAKKRIAEERRKATEALSKEIEAKKKEIEAKQKAETEKKATIRKMLKAEMKKALIADFLGLTLKKLNAYIREIQKEEQEKTPKKGE